MPDPILDIEAGRTERRYWRDIWEYRELFYFLSWRDVAVRYKQTAIGVLWGVLRPVLTMAIFVVVFGRLAKMPSGGMPYPLLVFSAMLPWQFFAGSLSEGSGSLVANANMISKVYFPRLVLPCSAVIVSLVDFLISFALLLALMVFYGLWPTWRMLAVVPLTGMAFAAALGAGLWLAALNVKYRDFRYIVPVVVQFGLYLSPVGFRSEVVPGHLRLLYSLNPMVGVIDGFRWAVERGAAFYWPGFLASLGAVAVLGATGLAYFRRTEREFADVI